MAPQTGNEEADGVDEADEALEADEAEEADDEAVAEGADVAAGGLEIVTVGGVTTTGIILVATTLELAWLAELL